LGWRIFPERPIREHTILGANGVAVMATLWWGAAVILTVAGTLLYWAAPILSAERFYGDAGILLFLALLLVGLSRL
jgi:hypothetical protein